MTRKQLKEKICTCEFGKLKEISKDILRYSICDVCSEKLFSKNKIATRNKSKLIIQKVGVM